MSRKEWRLRHNLKKRRQQETRSLERMELLALALLLFVAVKAEEVRRLMLCAASSLETISSNFTVKLEFAHFLS